MYIFFFLIIYRQGLPAVIVKGKKLPVVSRAVMGRKSGLRGITGTLQSSAIAPAWNLSVSRLGFKATDGAAAGSLAKLPQPKQP